MCADAESCRWVSLYSISIQTFECQFDQCEGRKGQQMAGHKGGRAQAGHGGRAGGLLRQADALLADSDWEHEPGVRFRTAYLAALRGAGAMIALTGADRA